MCFVKLSLMRAVDSAALKLQFAMFVATIEAGMSRRLHVLPQTKTMRAVAGMVNEDFERKDCASRGMRL